MAESVESDITTAVRALHSWPTNRVNLFCVAVDSTTGAKGVVEGRSFNKDATGLNYLAAFLRKKHGRANCYFHANEVDGSLVLGETVRDGKTVHKALESDIVAVVCTQVDLDPKDAPEPEVLDCAAHYASERERVLRLAMEYQPPFNVVNCSGSGAQAFHIYKHPSKDFAGCKARNEALKNSLPGGDSCHSLDHVFRVPGMPNIPDDRKLAKGRTLTKAYTLRQQLPGEYEPSALAAAPGTPKVATPTPTAAKPKRPTPVIDWDKVDPERFKDVNELDIEPHAKLTLYYGDNLLALHKDHHLGIGHRAGAGPYKSFSDCSLAVAGALKRGGYSVEDCASVLSSPHFPGNQHILKMTQVGHRRRAILRAIGNSDFDEAEQAAEALDQIEQINERHFVLKSVGGQCRVGFFEPSMIGDGHESVVFQKVRDFKDSYANRLVPIGEGYRPLGEVWFSHAQRREYDGIIFDPSGGEVVDNRLNLWRGFAVEPEQGDWEPMQRHILEVLCKGNTSYNQYVIRWLAWSVQNPDKQAEVAVTTRGLKGSGKGVVWRYVGSLFGQHGFHLSDPDHVVGKFNYHLMDCVFLFADEAFAQNNKAHEAALKRLITEPTLSIEPKGLGLFQCKNHIHLASSANAEWAVPSTHDERRHMVLDVSDDRVGDRDYFKKLYDQMDGAGRAAMLFDLQQMSLGDFHPRQVIRTDALARQIELSLEPEEQWWKLVLLDGALPGAWYHRPCSAYSEALFRSIRERSPKLKFEGDLKLAGFLRKQGAVDDRCHGGRGWRFEQLAECRATWSKRYPTTRWPDQQREWSRPPKPQATETKKPEPARQEGGTNDIPF